MSAQGTNNISGSMTPGVGSGATGMSSQQQASQTSSTAPSSSMSQQNLNGIVLEYLNKKGYSRTEAMLRSESSNVDPEGRPIHTDIKIRDGKAYQKAFGLTQQWIEDNIEIYKPEFRRLLWPIFVYSFLDLITEFYPQDSKDFYAQFYTNFLPEHSEDLRVLKPVSLPEHISSNKIAALYKNNKYRLTLSETAFNTLIQFLEVKEREGGILVLGILQNSCLIMTTKRSVDDRFSLGGMMERAQATEPIPAEDEGIPGHHPGSANTSPDAPIGVLPRLKLGPLPMEPDLMGDVQGELEELDAKNPPAPGENSLIQEWEQNIKHDESDDAPNRNDIPLPASLARDVRMEVQKVKESRDRFKIESRTGGTGPGVSVIMYTFHNTFDSVNCLEFSDDTLLVAAGMAESYIRVWSLDGSVLKSRLPPQPNDPPPSSSRRLIGHSGPVYGLSFSPSILSPEDPNSPPTGPEWLLSCSEDKSIRLWHLATWSCLVVYKGHDAPVWDISWGPFGHYFVSGGNDRTARLWATSHISCLRMFAGHDDDVDVVEFHPNNAYVFTASCDRSVRMWAVTTGNAVRMFTGHTGNITSMACSPTGKLLASADDKGIILIWDLASGRLKKRLSGHGQGGIWSLSWSAESSVLGSGGMDCTVRIWDMVGPGTEPIAEQGETISEAGTGIKVEEAGGSVAGAGAEASTNGTGVNGVGSGAITNGVNANASATTNTNASAGGTGSSTGKAKDTDIIVSPEQISVFPTKKSPVYKVKFTRQNLVMAAGVYLPENAR